MLTKRYRRHAALELGPEIDAYSNEGDRAILAVELSPFETLKLAVVATRRHPSSGLLAVTDKRLLFVQERLIARPVVLSIPYPEILDVSSAFDYVTGTIRLLLRDESERTFTYIIPNEPPTWRRKFGRISGSRNVPNRMLAPGSRSCGRIHQLPVLPSGHRHWLLL